jgi:DNA-binding NarL/FixJ family response regulator
MDYEEIRSIVQEGLKDGLISKPNRRDVVKKEVIIKPTKTKLQVKESPCFKLCNARKDEILDWHAKGWSQRQIAKELGMSPFPVARFFKAQGIKLVVGAYNRDPNKTYGRPKPI